MFPDADINSQPPAQLRVAEVRKRFGPLTALDGVTMDVEAGELFGLLGPNGAGKSTLLSIVAGLLDADAGSVTLEGKPVRPDLPDARRAIGIAPQDLALYPELTAAENLRFFGRLYGMRGPALERRMDELLDAVRLTDRRGDRVAGFSGGMKRRLNLAVAVLHGPRILLLDEPTAGVDPQSRHNIFEEVRRLNAGGMTVVYTSHYMEEVQSLCRRVAVIDHGKIIRCEPLTELLKLDESRIIFANARHTDALLHLLRELPAVTAAEYDGDRIEVRTGEPRDTLPALMRLLESMRVPATDLELRPPTLERVFLRLTGHDLRD